MESSNVCVNFYQTGIVLETSCKPGCLWDWGFSPSTTGCTCKGKQVIRKGTVSNYGEIKELHSKMVYCRTSTTCRRSEKHVYLSDCPAAFFCVSHALILGPKGSCPSWGGLSKCGCTAKVRAACPGLQAVTQDPALIF